MQPLERDQTSPPSRRPLAQLTNVPVEVAFTTRLLALLQAHGAQVRQTSTKQHTSANGRTSIYHEYTIEFPAGTQREDGLRLSRLAPFTIYFPDGYALPAVECFSQLEEFAGQSLIILHIPS